MPWKKNSPALRKANKKTSSKVSTLAGKSGSAIRGIIPVKKVYRVKTKSLQHHKVFPAKQLFRYVVAFSFIGLVVIFIATIFRINATELKNITSDGMTRSWTAESNLSVLVIGVDQRSPDLQFVDLLQVVYFQPMSNRATIIAVDPDLAVNIEEEFTGLNNVSLRNTFSFRQLYNHFLVRDRNGTDPLTSYIKVLEGELGITFDRYLLLPKQGFIELANPLGSIPYVARGAIESTTTDFQLQEGLTRLGPEEQLNLLATTAKSDRNTDAKLLRQAELLKNYLLEIVSPFNLVRLGMLVWYPDIIDNVSTNFTSLELWQVYQIIRNTPEYQVELTLTSNNQMYIQQNFRFLDKKIFDTTLSKVLRNQEVLVEQGRIDIINSTSKRGLAAKYQRLLTNKSFNVVRTGNTSDIYTHHTLYIADPQRFPNTISQLERLFPGLQIVYQDYPYRPTGDMVLVVIN